jgi:hypothetical protein
MYTLHDMMADAHRDTLMRDANAHRLASQVEKTSRSNTMLAALGRGMIKLGEQLSRENMPSPVLQPER